MRALTNEEKQRFADRLKALLEEKGATQADMARVMGVKSSSVFAWIHGTSIPRMDKLKKLAAWLGTSTDYLLGEKIRQRQSESMTPIDDMLQEMFHDDPVILNALTRGSYTRGAIHTDDGRVYNLSDADRETIKHILKLVIEKGGNSSC